MSKCAIAYEVHILLGLDDIASELLERAGNVRREIDRVHERVFGLGQVLQSLLLRTRSEFVKVYRLVK